MTTTTTEVYGDYIIDTDQETAGRWKSHIRRRDGRPISTAPYGPAFHTGSEHDGVLQQRGRDRRSQNDDRPRPHEVGERTMPAWMDYLAAAKTALDLLKGTRDLLPKGKQSEEATKK
jgi:hypothetical protein